MTKSEIFKKAHQMTQVEPDEFGNYRDTFAYYLSRVYREDAEVKAEANKPIGVLKEEFWSAWKNFKSAKYSRAPGQLGFYSDVFDRACAALRRFTTDEINASFGKYSDFVIAKI